MPCSFFFVVLLNNFFLLINKVTIVLRFSSLVFFSFSNESFSLLRVAQFPGDKCLLCVNHEQCFFSVLLLLLLHVVRDLRCIRSRFACTTTRMINDKAFFFSLSSDR